MAQVELDVQNRRYVVACEDGREDHVRKLAAHVDRHAAEVLAGQPADARLMLMVGLMVADELDETQKRVAALEGNVKALRSGRQTADQAMAERIQDAARRLEDVAGRLQGA